MSDLVLLGAYKNEDWDVFEVITEEEDNQRDKILQQYKEMFGEEWNFKWSRQ